MKVFLSGTISFVKEKTIYEGKFFLNLRMILPSQIGQDKFPSNDKAFTNDFQ